MSKIYDNWERLVDAVLDRETYRQLCRDNSSTYSVGTSSDFSSNLTSPRRSSVYSVPTSLDFSYLTSPLRHLRGVLSPYTASRSSPSSSPRQRPPTIRSDLPSPGNESHIKELVFKIDIQDDKQKNKMLKTVSSFSGVNSIAVDMKTKKLTVIGDFDPILMTRKLRKSHHTDILSLSLRPAS